MRAGILKAAISAATLVAGGQGNAANLVANGNFEAGNTGFTSSYGYSPATGLPASVYTVASNPNAWNGNFVTAGDHTTDSGQMFIANGSPVANSIVWQSSPIAITSLQNYFFEAFVMNVFASSPPILTFTISLDGGPEQVLNTLGVPATTGIWNGLSTTFNSGSATTASLFLRNAQTAGFGNDFVIDDISLDTTSIVSPPSGAVPEPSTWMMMLAGFGIAGSAMRRRRQKAIPQFA